MQTAALNYKLIKKIKDDRFDEDKIHQYSLLINIGTRDFQLGIVDTADHRLLLMEDFVFPNISNHDDQLGTLEKLFDAHAVLKAAFWNSIRISVKNNKFVQVPAALFFPDAAPEYLRYNAQIDNRTDEIFHIRNKLPQAVTVFAVPRQLTSWLAEIYPNRDLVYIHQSAAIIEGIMHLASKQKEDGMYVYIDRFKLHIVATGAGKLVYYNQFVIRQFSDYVKYIMLVMNSLGRKQDKSRIMLWGYIGKNSPHYHELYRYISNVVFGSRPVYLKFGYMFDEVQDHHFLDLYSMHLINKG